ncbi:MAG: PCRF domain-containing protein, partial [Verrucomicrobiae bacterium]|nr:PCRF domain-containing protein [Verrucomicrobiae bacterium]
MNPLPNIDRFRERIAQLEADLSNPAVFTDQRRAGELARELQRLRKLLADAERCESLQKQIAEHQKLLADPELAPLAKAELDTLRRELERAQQDVKAGLVPPDPNDSRNIIVEIRAGTGGEEAALFAADLFRMYSRYAEAHRYKVELLDESETGIGGYKEVIFAVHGKGAYSRLKWE